MTCECHIELTQIQNSDMLLIKGVFIVLIIKQVMMTKEGKIIVIFRYPTLF